MFNLRKVINKGKHWYTNHLKNDKLYNHKPIILLFYNAHNIIKLNI